MNNDTLSHITLQHLSKQIQRDLLEVVDPFIGKGVTEQLYQEILHKAEIVWNLEKTLHKLYKKYDYKPLQNFGGKTECFKI